MAEANRLRPSFAGIEQLFDAVGAEPNMTQNVISWSVRMDTAIKALGARFDNASQVFDQTVLLLKDYTHIFSPGGEAASLFADLQERLHEAQTRIPTLSASVGLASPDALFTFTPGGLDDLSLTIAAGPPISSRRRNGSAGEPQHPKRVASA